MTFQLASTQLSAVTAYTQAQIRTAESAIINNHADLFNQITTASSTGLTSVVYSLQNTLGDQTDLVLLLNKYGYTANISNNLLTVDWSSAVSLALPSSPITGMNLKTFNGVVSTALSVIITPVGGVAPYTFTYSGVLPNGCAFASYGTMATIAGTPLIATEQYRTLTITVEDNSFPTVQTFSQAVDYTIAPLNTVVNASPVSPTYPITAINKTSFVGITGILLVVIIKPVGGVAPYTFSFSGTLPRNCTYTSTTTSFIISGAPDTPVVRLPGLTMTVTDSLNNSFSQDIDYTITQGSVINLTAGLGTSYISALGMMMP